MITLKAQILTALLVARLLFPIALLPCDNPHPDIDDQALISAMIKHGKDGLPGKNGQNGQNGENGQKGGNGGKGGDSDWGRGGDGGDCD